MSMPPPSGNFGSPLFIDGGAPRSDGGVPKSDVMGGGGGQDGICRGEKGLFLPEPSHNEGEELK